MGYRRTRGDKRKFPEKVSIPDKKDQDLDEFIVGEQKMRTEKYLNFKNIERGIENGDNFHI